MIVNKSFSFFCEQIIPLKYFVYNLLTKSIVLKSSKHGSAKYSPQIKSSLLYVCINFIRRHHIHSFTHCLWLLMLSITRDMRFYHAERSCWLCQGYNIYFLIFNNNVCFHATYFQKVVSAYVLSLPMKLDILDISCSINSFYRSTDNTISY